MKILNAFIAFLWTLAISVEFPYGSVSVTRVLNVGDNMTLDCVTDWDPGINMYWARRKNGPGDYIAQAGSSYPEGKIYEKFRYDPRISVSYYSFVNVSSDKEVSKVPALSISNITEQDSAEYICTSTNVTNEKPIYLYFYNIRVVTCNCSIDTNVTCNLIGFNSPHWQPLTIIFNGGTVKTGVIGNRLTFGPHDLNEMALEPSIRLFSNDGLMSDITCILLPVHSNPSSTQMTTTTVLPSQPRQSSVQGTTRIIRPTNEPSPSHELLSTIITSLQNTKLTTMSRKSGSQRHLRSSSSPSSSQPSISLIKIQATLSTKMQEQLETSSERDEASTTDMTTKPKKESDYNNIIIALCVSILAAIICIAVFIVMRFRRRYYKSSNVRGGSKSQKCRAKSTGKRFRTHSTAIPDFEFNTSTMRTSRLNGEESSHGHSSTFPADLQKHQAMPTEMLNLLEVERSDSRVDLSDKGSSRKVMQMSTVIPMKEFKDSHGQDIPDDNLYFFLENVSTYNSPKKNLCTPSSLIPHQIEGASSKSSNKECKASDGTFVENILYESSDAVPMTMNRKQGQNAGGTHLYFVLDNDNLYPAPPPFDYHLKEVSNAGSSGHLYEDIDSTRKLVEGGARCTTHIHAMPDKRSNTTDVRMKGCGKGYPYDSIKDANDTSSANMASVSTGNEVPLYAQID